MACGAVTVQPFIGQPAGVLPLFGTGNCDGSPTPGQELAASESASAERRAQDEIDCSGAYQEACEEIRRRDECTHEALGLTETLYPGSTTGVAVGGVTQALDNAAASDLYAGASPRVETAGKALGWAAKVGQVVGVYRGLASAIDGCS